MTHTSLPVKIPHNAYVFVGDGRKALFLRNEGDEKFPNLKTEQVMTNDNPPTRDQGTDKPGRSYASVGARRSSMEQADWHQIEEQRFAHEVAGIMAVLVREKNVPALIIAAPPKTLAELRRAFHPEVTKLIIAEIDKDLTHHPVYDIERRLTAA